MEQIYTIPVNEAFEASMEDKSLGCPFCRLYRQLEENELDLMLGASMMEPDVRQKTNEAGFCSDHWKKLFYGGKKLPLSLIIQSHLAEIDQDMMKKPGLVPAISGADTAKQLTSLSCDCYICKRIDNNFKHMLETAALLWDADENFKIKFAAQPCFCLPHFAGLVSEAKATLKSKNFANFYKSAYAKEDKYLTDTKNKIDSFAKKFDYRYANDPWNGEQKAVEEALVLLCGDEGIV